MPSQVYCNVCYKCRSLLPKFQTLTVLPAVPEANSTWGMWSLQWNTSLLKGFLVAQAAELAVKAGVASGGGAALPGLMMNLNKTYKDQATGQEQDVRGGRLECAMQVRPDVASPATWPGS